MNRKRKTQQKGCDYAIWIKQCLGYFRTDTINERTAEGSEKGGDSASCRKLCILESIQRFKFVARPLLTQSFSISLLNVVQNTAYCISTLKSDIHIICVHMHLKIKVQRVLHIWATVFSCLSKYMQHTLMWICNYFMLW